MKKNRNVTFYTANGPKLKFYNQSYKYNKLYKEKKMTKNRNVTFYTAKGPKLKFYNQSLFFSHYG